MMAQTFTITMKKMEEREGAPTSVVQVHSTADTVKAITVFHGEQTEDANEWIKEVNRISRYANWTVESTLLNATTRLGGAARDWHRTEGRKHDTWSDWSAAFISRFHRCLTFTEFIERQAQRVLRDDETLLAYGYAKNAILEKSPTKLSVDDRVDMILKGIQDSTWVIPLMGHKYSTVEELIDQLDRMDRRR